MKVTFKSIKGEEFSLEIEGTEKVSELVDRLMKEKNISVSKLIHQGKVLTSDMTAAEAKIQDGALIVMMVKKGPKPSKPAPAPTTAVAASATNSSTSTATASSPGSALSAAAASAPAADATAATPASAPSSTPASATEPAAVTSPGASIGMVHGPELEAAISQMVDMGFPRPEVLRALRAANHFPEVAMQYLLDGIPEGLADVAPPPPTAAEGAAGAGATPAGGDAGSAGATATDGATGAVTPEALAAALGGIPPPQPAAPQIPPVLQQLLQLVRQNPSALQPALAELARQHPQLYAQIQQNPDAFMQLLSGGLGDMSEGGGVGEQITVTAEEKAAIDRLVALGFPEAAAAEAYLACDKNEELAANFLLNNFQG